MSAKHFIALARRMWSVREQMDDAYLVFDRRRWQALQRRHDRLQEMVLSYAREGVTA